MFLSLRRGVGVGWFIEFVLEVAIVCNKVKINSVIVAVVCMVEHRNMS